MMLHILHLPKLIAERRSTAFSALRSSAYCGRASFGTGYYLLSYLRSFPFDKIKVDRTFVSGLTEGDEHVAIVRAVVSLARALGMMTTAEGIETSEQKRSVAALGCDEAQGYLFSAPVPVEKVPEILAAWAPKQIRAA